MLSDEEVAQTIARLGWQALSITDCPTPFVYTCGLMTTFKHPELIIFNPDTDAGYTILSTMFEAIRKGQSFSQAGSYDGILAKSRVAVRVVHPTQHELYLGYAMGHCTYMGRIGELVAMQVFWPDATGHFPFERECDDEVYRAQPRLDLQVPPSELKEFRAKWGS